MASAVKTPGSTDLTSNILAELAQLRAGLTRLDAKLDAVLGAVVADAEPTSTATSLLELERLLLERCRVLVQLGGRYMERLADPPADTTGADVATALQLAAQLGGTRRKRSKDGEG